MTAWATDGQYRTTATVLLDRSPGTRYDCWMGNPVVHFEVYGTNSAELRAFYTRTFGWKLAIPPGGEYAMVNTDSTSTVITGGIAEAAEFGSGVVVYILVADIDECLERIVAAGGSVLRPRTEFGPVTTALFTDPGGNVVGLTEEPPPVSPH